MRVLQLSMLARLRVECLIRQNNRSTRTLIFVTSPNAEKKSSNLQWNMYKSSLMNKERICCSSKQPYKCTAELFHSVSAIFSREINIPALKPSEITEAEYEVCAEDTLDSLTEFFEDLPEKEPCNDDYDCAYGSGVLTVHLGSAEGTYVINKQSPNKQIWLSSPLSGPKRFDYFDGQWVYLRDGQGLHHLLEEELMELLGFKIDLKNCKYFSWGIPDDK